MVVKVKLVKVGYMKNERGVLPIHQISRVHKVPVPPYQYN
jgi:hypothetical protein